MLELPIDNDLKATEDLICLFNKTFQESTNTLLVKGDNEPIYLPMDIDTPHNQIIFANGFFSSALHEVSHWCIAGEARRKLVDFGYWYEPDGRTASQQAEFEKVEVKPQAIEWLLSLASGRKFNISLDNLIGDAIDQFRVEIFKDAVYEQALSYFDGKLPHCATLFINALLSFYKLEKSWDSSLIKRSDI